MISVPAPARADAARLAAEIAAAHGLESMAVEHPYDADGTASPDGEIVVRDPQAVAALVQQAVKGHNPDTAAASVPPLTDAEIVAIRAHLGVTPNVL